MIRLREQDKALGVLVGIGLFCIIIASCIGLYKAFHISTPENTGVPQVVHVYKVTEWEDGLGEYKIIKYFPGDGVYVHTSEGGCMSLTQDMKTIYAHCGKGSIELETR